MRLVNRVTCLLIISLVGCWPSQAAELWSAGTSATLPAVVKKKKAPPQQGPSAAWGAPVTLTPKEKPGRERTEARKQRIVQKVVQKKKVHVEVAPLLCLRWSLRQADAMKQPQPVYPENIFPVKTLLQLVVTVNQPGHLYIFQNSKEKGIAEMIFPDPDINSGKNEVKGNVELTIPTNCAEEFKQANGTCWFEVADDDDDLTVIFSRDIIKAFTTGGTTVKQEVLEKIKRDSTRDFNQSDVGKFMIQYTNRDKANNEDLYIETKIRHK